MYLHPSTVEDEDRNFTIHPLNQKPISREKRIDRRDNKTSQRKLSSKGSTESVLPFLSKELSLFLFSLSSKMSFHRLLREPGGVFRKERRPSTGVETRGLTVPVQPLLCISSEPRTSLLNWGRDRKRLKNFGVFG